MQRKSCTAAHSIMIPELSKSLISPTEQLATWRCGAKWCDDVAKQRTVGYNYWPFFTVSLITDREMKLDSLLT